MNTPYFFLHLNKKELGTEYQFAVNSSKDY